MQFEDVTPNPEYLIKSIAEQGYSLEAALADLMDNSVSANADKIEMLTKIGQEPFVLYLADNGDGMDEESLKANMRFPSESPDKERKASDLGRFGLGLKTASFSQTRKFTVISKKKGSTRYAGRTWDLSVLQEKKWRLLVNTDEEIKKLLKEYEEQSEDYLGGFGDYEANTIIIWRGLYKFEDYLEENNRKAAFKREITEVVTDHLSLVFHRFMERKKNPLQIRVNNTQLQPFNPFPLGEKDLRPVEYKQKIFRSDSIKLEGFILPSRSIDEDRESNFTKWTTKHRSLIDMEGIYIYRADRIILFGGWNGLIKKAPRLQLARLRVEIGNSVDHLLHLNVAKSQVIIPHDLKGAFESYISELKDEAQKEFYNRGTKKIPTKYENKITLFERRASNKGMLLEINNNFPVLQGLFEELSSSGRSKLKILMKMINTQISNIRQTHEDKTFLSIEDNDNLSVDELLVVINGLISNSIEKSTIKTEILPRLGYTMESFPSEITEVLND